MFQVPKGQWDLRVRLEKLVCLVSQVLMVCQDTLALKDHQDLKATEVDQELEDHKVTQAFLDQRGAEENEVQKERRVMRDC